MGLRFIVNGRVVDNGEPIEEAIESPAQAADGRLLVPYTSAVYYQNGQVDTITDRAFNAAIKLPPSGNISKVLGAPRTEASENPQTAAVRQAQADTTAALNDLQAQRDAYVQDALRQQAVIDAEYRAATTLKPVDDAVTTTMAGFQKSLRVRS